jgi:hypothetical protein
MISPTPLEFFVLAALTHFTVDIVFQSDFVAKFKARQNSLPAIPWVYVLLGHAASHGLALALLLITVLGGGPYGVPVVEVAVRLAVVETLLHFGIDTLKNEGVTNIHHDQLLHIVCKAFYAVWLAPVFPAGVNL